MPEGIASRVEVLPVTVKIHWHPLWCDRCTGDCEKIAHEMYQCLSCGWVNNGHNKYIQGQAHRLNSLPAPAPALTS